MSIQPLEVVDFDTIEHLNFDPPCEHSGHGIAPWHSGSAWALVQCLDCPDCGDGGPEFLLCHSAWDDAGANGLECTECGATLTREQGWRFIALVRP